MIHVQNTIYIHIQGHRTLKLLWDRCSPRSRSSSSRESAAGGLSGRRRNRKQQRPVSAVLMDHCGEGSRSEGTTQPCIYLCLEQCVGDLTLLSMKVSHWKLELGGGSGLMLGWGVEGVSGPLWIQSWNRMEGLWCRAAFQAVSGLLMERCEVDEALAGPLGI